MIKEEQRAFLREILIKLKEFLSREIIVKKSLLALLLGSIVFSGCATSSSEAPVVTNFVNGEQNKPQAGAHWESIANHLAKTVVDQMGSKKGVYVNEPVERSRFDTALHNLLLSALVKEGVSVAKFPAAAEVSVDVKTQMVKFSKDRATSGYDQFDPKYDSGETPQNEVIITVNATDNAQYVSSVSNVYYISDSDAALYKKPTLGRKMNVEGNKK